VYLRLPEPPAGAPAGNVNNGGNDDPTSQQSDQRAQFDNDDTPEVPEDPESYVDGQIKFYTDGGRLWQMEAARLCSFE